MKTILHKLARWYELNLSWFFINGRKEERHKQYLKNKYYAKKD